MEESFNCRLESSKSFIYRLSHAIIMAGGRGSRMLDLTSRIPKPLLSIANKPLIWYPVNYLEKCGFEEVIIVTLESIKDDIYRALVEENDVQIAVDIVGIKDENEWGTADSLRYITDKINCDNILVLSCDTVTFIPLQLLANMHRIKDSSLTLLLSSRPSHMPDASIGPKSKIRYEKDIIGIDNADKILVYGAEADYEETISFKSSFLLNHPNFDIYSTLMDSHIYMMKKWILNYLVDNRNISSIKGDLIPKLIKRQFKPSFLHAYKKASLSHSSQACDHILDDPLNEISISRLNNPTYDTTINSHTKVGSNDGANQDSPVKKLDSPAYLELFYKATKPKNFKPNFHALVYNESPNACIRVHTYHEYCLANKLVLKYHQQFFDDTEAFRSPVIEDKSIHISQDSLIDEGHSIKENVTIKKSIVGKHSVIDAGVKIVNCIIGNHVIIREGSSLQNSIILNNSELGKCCEIKDSFVGCSQNLPDKCKITNEEILDRVFMEI